MIEVGINMIFAVGFGLLAAAVAMAINVFRPRERVNPALSAFLTFVIVFGVLMAWDANR